ncbi:class I SAM-dependent methyltransferase [Bradyrhizobium sp. CCBAU 25338]|uniref:class I SAM-dependent methyltransferase n=1 Tax=Bradyrhizobium sp. CCBAU 25338 TaxID=1641877 RepID=UPI0023047633|nr:class I SAM-dependent methyltransferase [Bradyrhizobium sp. CCBAU 25338]
MPLQVHGLDGAAEWPDFRAMLPDFLESMWSIWVWFREFSRWMRGGLCPGLDLSQNMIARAKADTADAAITYRIADLDTLELPEAVATSPIIETTQECCMGTQKKHNANALKRIISSVDGGGAKVVGWRLCAVRR